MTLITFFQEAVTYDWTKLFNVGLGIFGFVCLVGAAIIVLISKRREDVQQTETKRADSNARLVETRDKEIEDLKKENKILEDELESVTAEYRTLVGIDINLLFTHWTTREQDLAIIGQLRQENRVLKKRLGDDV